MESLFLNTKVLWITEYFSAKKIFSNCTEHFYAYLNNYIYNSISTCIKILFLFLLVPKNETKIISNEWHSLWNRLRNIFQKGNNIYSFKQILITSNNQSSVEHT